jgi:hypothetical protein
MSAVGPGSAEPPEGAHRAGAGLPSVPVTRRCETDLLAELVALLDAEYGPVSGAALAEAEAVWPDRG